MNGTLMENLLPEVRANKIFEACGIKPDRDMARDLWQEMPQHEGLMSEKLCSDVGYHGAYDHLCCLNFTPSDAA